MDDEVLFFVKFGKMSHSMKLLRGKVHFSNAEMFRGIEAEKGRKGQGDAYEAVLRLNNGNGVYWDEQTWQMTQFENATLKLELSDIGKIPVFCITAITKKNCIFESDGFVRFSKEFETAIRHDFPGADSAALFYEPRKFIDCFSRQRKAISKMVDYFNFTSSENCTEFVDYLFANLDSQVKQEDILLSMYYQGNDGCSKQRYMTGKNSRLLLFCKDLFFRPESEYRFILPNKRITTPTDYSIRFDGQKRELMPIDDFFQGISLTR